MSTWQSIQRCAPWLLLPLAAVPSLLTFPGNAFAFSIGEFWNLADGRGYEIGYTWLADLALVTHHGPFLPMIARLYEALGVDGEVAHRLVGFAFFLGAVGLAYGLARCFLEPVPALVAGLVVAWNTEVVWISNLFLRYSLHLALGIGCLWAVVRSLQRAGRAAGVLLGLLTCLAVINHLMSLYALAACGVVWLLWRQPRNRWWTAACAGAGVALTLPWLYWLLAGVIFLERMGTPSDTGRDLGLVASLFGVALPVAVLIGLGVLVHRRRAAVAPEHPVRDLPHAVLCALALALIPPGLFVLVGVFSSTATRVPYILSSVAGLGLLVGALFQLGGHGVRAVILIAVLLGGGRAVTELLERDDWDYFPETTALLELVPDRSTPTFFWPPSTRHGVYFYHRRNGSGDLTLLDALPETPPPELCVLEQLDHTYELHGPSWIQERARLARHYQHSAMVQRTERFALVCFAGRR